MHRKRLAAFVVLAVLQAGSIPAQLTPFVRGDANRDSRVDLSDGVAIFGFLFLGRPNPGCTDSMDANDSGIVDLSDGIYDLNFLFIGGLMPPPPFPACGLDPSPDAIDCADFPLCVACLDQAALDAAITKSVPPVTCIAAGETQVTVGALVVDVCPLALAMPCGDDGVPGCPVNFTTIDGALDVGAREVVVHIEGNIQDLPIVVTDTNTGTMTNCLNDVTFSADAVVPFLAENDPEGNLVLVQLLDIVLENPMTTLDSTGGFLCSLLEGLQSLFEKQLIAELQSAAQTLLADLNTELVGSILCTQ